MANICENNEYIFGPKDQMSKLYDIFDKMFEDPKNEFHPISFIIKSLELEDLHLYSRCEILEYVKDYDEIENIYILSFSSDSAWNSMYETWDEILKEKFPDCKYAFLSIEPGCEVFEVRDPYDRFGISDYYVNIDINICGEEANKELPKVIRDLVEKYKDDMIYDSWNEDEVRSFIKNLCNIEKDISTEGLLELLEEWNNSNEYVYVSIHPYLLI